MGGVTHFLLRKLDIAIQRDQLFSYPTALYKIITRIIPLTFQILKRLTVMEESNVCTVS